MSERQSLGELLRLAFLRGETVSLVAFSETHKVSRQAVHSAIKRFGGMVKSKRGPQHCLLFDCIDLSRMQAFVPPPYRGQGRRKIERAEKAKADTPVGRLQEAWGIAVADIALPYTRHHMAVADDEIEAA